MTLRDACAWDLQASWAEKGAFATVSSVSPVYRPSRLYGQWSDVMLAVLLTPLLCKHTHTQTDTHRCLQTLQTSLYCEECSRPEGGVSSGCHLVYLFCVCVCEIQAEANFSNLLFELFTVMQSGLLNLLMWLFVTCLLSAWLPSSTHQSGASVCLCFGKTEKMKWDRI